MGLEIFSISEDYRLLNNLFQEKYMFNFYISRETARKWVYNGPTCGWVAVYSSGSRSTSLNWRSLIRMLIEVELLC